MSVQEYYPDFHEYEIKLDLKQALQSMFYAKRLGKTRYNRMRVIYVLVQKYVNNRTIESIAQDLGLSQGRTWQLEQKGLYYLRRNLLKGER